MALDPNQTAEEAAVDAGLAQTPISKAGLSNAMKAAFVAAGLFGSAGVGGIAVLQTQVAQNTTNIQNIGAANTNASALVQGTLSVARLPAVGGDASGTLTGLTVNKINGQSPAAVATSGSYADLQNKPTIPPASATVTGIRKSAGAGSTDVAATSSDVGALLPVNTRDVVMAAAQGVVCDGVTDANAGGVLAAASALATSLNADLYLPTGKTCRIKTGLLDTTGPTHWRCLSTCTVQIDPGASLVTNSAGQQAAVLFSGLTDLLLDNIVFSGPGQASPVDGSPGVGQATGTNHRLLISSVNQVNITRSTFQNFGIGAFIQGSIAGTTLTVSSILSGGPLVAGMHISNISVNGGNIVQQLSGATGGTGTYQLDNSSTVASTTFGATIYAQGLVIFGGSGFNFQADNFNNNSGDGIAFSNSNAHVHILDSSFLNNGDSAIACTIGGNDFHSRGNTMVAPAGNPSPTLVFDRCRNVWAEGDNITGGGQGVRVTRYGDTTDISTGITIRGEQINGTSNNCISIESAAKVQGTNGNSPNGGNFTVTGNSASNCGGAGVNISDDDNGVVTNNTIVNPAGPDILVTGYNGGTTTQNIYFAGNVGIGGTYGIQQVLSTGTLGVVKIGPNTWSGQSNGPMSVLAPYSLVAATNYGANSFRPYTAALTASGTGGSGSGSFTQGQTTASFRQDFDMTTISADAKLTNNGNGSSTLNLSLPTTVKTTTPCAGQELTTGKPLIGAAVANTSTISFTYLDGTYPGANNTEFRLGCTYQGQ